MMGIIGDRWGGRWGYVVVVFFGRYCGCVFCLGFFVNCLMFV